MANKVEAIFQEAQAGLIEALRRGVAPWRQSWTAGHARPWNVATGREYRGLTNAFLLMLGAMRCGGGNAWIGWGQAADKGGRVKPDEAKRYTWILAPMVGKKRNAATGDEESRLYGFRTVHVYNVAQCEGITVPAPVGRDNAPDEAAEAIVASYSQRPAILVGQGRPAYLPVSDAVTMPHRTEYTSSAAYYVDLFHELMHSTGHAKRQARPGITNTAGMGSHEYSEEELVAELGAAYLCAVAGITSETEQSAAYLQGWLSRLENDGTILHRATMAAQRGARLILAQYLADEAAAEAADEAAA